MSHQHGGRIAHRRTPESAAMVVETRRAMAITARLNRLTFDDADQVRASPSELCRAKKVDDSFLRTHRFYATGGNETRPDATSSSIRTAHSMILAGDRHRGRRDDRAEREHHHLRSSARTSERRSVTIGKPIVIE